MNRRQFVRASAGAALLTQPQRSESARPRRANILVFMTDQQPVSTLGVCGNRLAQTPHVDQLAREGVLLENHYIAAFPCSPSRSVMLSGRYAHNTEVVTNDVLFAEQIDTIADTCARHGYATAHFGKYHLGGHMYRRRPEDAWFYQRVDSPDDFRFEKHPGGPGEDEAVQGFREWQGGWRQYRDYLQRVGHGDLLQRFPGLGNHNMAPSAPEGRHMFSQVPAENHEAAFSTDNAIDFINRQRGANRPWLCWVSIYGPHLPVCPPRPWDSLFPAGGVPLPSNHHDDHRNKPLAQTNERTYKLDSWTDRQFQDYIARYWGYCAYIDAQFGRILTALSETGQADDTLVLFTSDHGDMVGEHGSIYKLGSNGYDCLMRVPTVIRWPQQLPSGHRVEALTSHVDLAPTLCELAGVFPPTGSQGASMANLLRGRADHGRETVVCDVINRSLMIRDERWKFVLHWSRRTVDELYDLQEDRGEMVNRAADSEQRHRVTEFKDRLVEWLTDAGHPYAHTIRESMRKTILRLQRTEARPTHVSIAWEGGRGLRLSYQWQVASALGGDRSYWSFTHFVDSRRGPGDKSIVFRNTTWPQPATTEWKADDVIPIGPIDLTIPAQAPSGNYEVRIGLYDPNSHTAPPPLVGSRAAYVVVGTLSIKHQGDVLSEVVFTPRGSPPQR